MYSIDDRDRARDHVLLLAEDDERVVAGAVVGSLAHGSGDRWSDIDLTFAVEDRVPVLDVLEDWTRHLSAELDAVPLFDVPSGGFLYRVFLLPGCLQLDLSFAPASAFAARGPSFRLLFGRAGEPAYARGQPASEMFGYAVHHALRARFCIERGRWWQAEYWISSLRDLALSLACRRRGLADAYGRGFDELPAEVRKTFQGALVRSLDRDELHRALGHAIERLLDQAEEAPGLAGKVEPQLRALMRDPAS